MMKKRLLVVFMGLPAPLHLWCGTISGRIVDSATGEAIPYVNVGVVEGQRGKVSDEQGYFRLELTGIDSEATLRFSFIGYDNHDIPVAGIEQLRELPCQIQLVPKILEFQEIVVYPREFREKVVGNPHPPRFMKAGFSSDSLGYEWGIFVRLKQSPTLLKELRLHGIETTYDSIFYRLNVYEMNHDSPGRNILKSPIYFTLFDIKNNEDISIDLSAYHIVVLDDFVVTLEYVKELGEGRLTFSTGVLNGRVF